jgi:uncharacterized lipoprotein YbaY
MRDEEEPEKRTATAAPTSPLLRGEIVFDNNNVKPFTGATVYIRLEDVTMQDVPSKLITQQVIKDVSYDDDIAGHHHQKKLEFELFGDIEIIDSRAMYAVRVYTDVDNNGKINSGEYINMESCPVITHGYPKYSVLVRVRRVK